MSTIPLSREWVSEYKSALPKTGKVAKRIRGNLWTVVSMLVLGPLFGAFILASLSDLQVVLRAVGSGVFDGGLIIGLFLGLRLYERGPRTPALRSAGFVFASVALGFIHTDWVFEISSNLPTRDEVLPLSLCITQCVWLLATGIVLVRRLRFFERGKLHSAYIPIRREFARELWYHVDELTNQASTLGLPPLAVSAWLSRTNSELLPSVCVSDRGRSSNLLIPRPFLRLLANSREQARAIVAHELSHFYQNDANLWTVTDLFFAALRRTAVPMLALNLMVIVVIVILTSEAQYLSSLSGSLPPLVIILSSQRIVASARKKSELRADQFACQMSSRQGLIEAIQNYTGDESVLHPSRRERIAALAGGANRG